MRKTFLSGLLVMALTVVVGVSLYGCATTTGSSPVPLPSGTNPGDPIPSPEATLTGAVGVASGGEVDINLGGIIPTGSTEAVPVSLSKMAVYVSEGTNVSAADIGASAATWSLVDIGFYTGSATPIDIVFILDNTGSMGGTITGVKDSIVAFAQTLEAAGVDAKFGLVTYGDSALHPTPPGYITSEGFTDASYLRPVLDLTTAASLEGTLATVHADGGGDGPENPLDGVKWSLTTNASTGAFENITWRTGAQKVLVILTDINGHQSVEADTSSNNKCTTTATLEIARIRNFTVKVYAVSPNYTYDQWPYVDVRKLADGFGEGRTTAEAVLLSSGGAWTQMPYGGSVDLTTLGISSSVSAGGTIRISGYTFTSGTIYTIIVYYDVDSDGVADSYAYFVFCYSTTGGCSVLSSSPVMPLEADDFKDRSN